MSAEEPLTKDEAVALTRFLRARYAEFRGTDPAFDRAFRKLLAMVRSSPRAKKE